MESWFSAQSLLHRFLMGVSIKGGTVAGAHKGDWALPLIDQQFPNQLPEGVEVEVDKQQHRKRTTALDVFKSARL